MKDMIRILTATYGVALALMMFTYITYAAAKPTVKPTVNTTHAFSWGDSLNKDDAAYKQAARK